MGGDENKSRTTVGSQSASTLPGIRLGRLGHADSGRLRKWLELPTVQAWWGSRSRAEAEIAVALASPSAICRTILLGDELIGYAHALDSALLEGNARSRATVDSGTWECAVFIASETHRGRGLGGQALELLVAEVFSTTFAVACTLRVPVTKEHAVRAIEAAGFKWVRVESDPGLGRVWLMRRDRPTGPARP